MKISRIEKVETEARELLERIEILKINKKSEFSRNGYCWGSHESSSVRRQSMELTRALSALRKS
jgi:hypothetical protein